MVVDAVGVRAVLVGLAADAWRGGVAEVGWLLARVVHTVAAGAVSIGLAVSCGGDLAELRWVLQVVGLWPVSTSEVGVQLSLLALFGLLEGEDEVVHVSPDRDGHIARLGWHWVEALGADVLVATSSAVADAPVNLGSFDRMAANKQCGDHIACAALDRGFCSEGLAFDPESDVHRVEPATVAVLEVGFSIRARGHNLGGLHDLEDAGVA